MATAEDTVRKYLTAVRDPESLRDEEAINERVARLESSSDPIERLMLQEEIRTLAAPTLDSIEDEFVVHAKAWADEMGISGKAFAAEGVPTAVLRRAGFQVGTPAGRAGRRSTSTRKSSGTRVTTESVIDAMPSGAFTVKSLREASGASPAVVRKAILAEQEAGRLTDLGSDPDHRGPGRSPTLYKKA